MLDIVKYFKTLITLEQIHTDNIVFKLHYKVTLIMLVAFSIALSSKQYFGDPIICDVPNRDLINIFCWIFSTFIVRTTLTEKDLPGLGLGTLGDAKNISKQHYYQWVCLVFCVQAFIFYIPRYLWKIWESGRLQSLLTDIAGPTSSPNWNSDVRDKLVEYLLSGGCTNNIYVLRYCFCEFLNLANVIIQICFMDWFLTGNFSIYGIAYATHHLVNPMDEFFPKLTKCTYFKFGPSGTIMNFDALCLLPLNVLNEKFFLALWYWLFFLMGVSFFALIYRANFLFIPKFRVYLLRALTRNIDNKKAGMIVTHITYGDFFILYRIGKNMNPIMYKELVDATCDSIINKGKDFSADATDV